MSSALLTLAANVAGLTPASLKAVAVFLECLAQRRLVLGEVRPLDQNGLTADFAGHRKYRLRVTSDPYSLELEIEDGPTIEVHTHEPESWIAIWDAIGKAEKTA